MSPHPPYNEEYTVFSGENLIFSQGCLCHPLFFSFPVSLLCLQQTWKAINTLYCFVKLVRSWYTWIKEIRVIFFLLLLLLFWAASCSSLQGKNVCLTGKRAMLCINHLYLNLCCAKIQFSALCRVQYWLYGFIYTSKPLSSIINLFLSHAVWMAFLEGELFLWENLHKNRAPNV